MQAIGQVLNFRAVLERHAPDKARLLDLIGLPNTAQCQTGQASIRDETLRLQTQLTTLREDDPDDPECDRVALALADARTELARFDALLSQCIERDHLAGERPPECWCLGVGGGGPVPSERFPGKSRDSAIVFLNGGLFFERWCSCFDALRMQEERRDWHQRKLADVANQHAAKLARARDVALRASMLSDKQGAYRIEAWANALYNGDALDHLADYVESGISWDGKPGLYLFGDAGIGKTACSATAVRRWIERATELEAARDGMWDELAPGSCAVFVDVPLFLREVKDSFNAKPPNTKAVTWRAYLPGLVIFDDFGAEYQTPWVRATLLEIVNFRCQRRLPTIFTSNYALDALSERLTISGAEDVEATRLVGRVREMASPVNLVGDDLRV